jgi:uncharacterized caspase-like protein
MKDFPAPLIRIPSTLLLALALLSCIASIASAQPASRGLASELNRNSEGQGGVAELPGVQKRWALIVGVDQYKDPQIGRLSGAANDAHVLADALVRYAGFPADQVILLATDQPEERQPTRVNILRRLSNLVAVVPKDGLLLLSFAGHGMERGGQAFLLPSDAQISGDMSFMEETSLSVPRMKERIKATGVKQVLVLLDACRNDPGGRADAPNRLTDAYKFNFNVKNREVEAFATIYATAIGQRAYEYSEKRQGYFTWAVVEGLKGGAANDKGEVSLASLVNYVQTVVPKRIGIDLGASSRQRPFAVIEGYKAESLIIAFTKPPTGLVAAEPEPPPTAAVADVTVELSFWDSIKSSNDPEDFRAYISQYPQGKFVQLARNRLNGLTEAMKPVPTAPVIPAPTIPTGWMMFSPAGSLFSVGMPTQPKEDVNTTAGPNGPYTTHLFTAMSADREIYLVGWVDYDPKFNFGVQAELEANRDNFVKSLKATLLSTTPVKLSAHPGIEFKAEIPGKFDIVSRVYIVGRRPYQLIMVTPAGRDASANRERFFSSFHLGAAK